MARPARGDAGRRHRDREAAEGRPANLIRDRSVNQPSRRQGPVGFQVIGALKLASTALLLGAGLGIFHMINKDLGEIAERYVARLHLDPDDRLVHAVLEQVSGLTRKRLVLIGAGTFFYALLHAIEGIGLILRRTWAGYFTAIITGSLLPLELYEVARKPTAVRIGVLVVNLVILVYVIVKLIQEHRDRAGRAAPSEART